MSITNVGFTSSTNQLMVDKAMENYEKYVAQKESEDSTSKTNTDSYEKTDSSVSAQETGIYSKENIMKTVEQIEQQRQSAMTQMISEMLGQQAQASGMDFIFGNSGSLMSTITQADIDEAQASIEGDGYWSVNSVATRIMDMAELLADGDSSKLATLKDAIIKGFGGAVSQLGYDSLDQMPDITQQTYAEVMKRFDKWQSELDAEA